MKRSVKITLIVAASLVGLGLCLSAVGFLMGGRLSDLRNMRFAPATGQWEQHSTPEPTETPYTGSSYTLPEGTEITTLNIDWITGDVTVRVTDNEVVTVEESIGRSGGIAHPMTVASDNGTLQIRYAEREFLGLTDLPEKELTVCLPRTVAEHLTEVRFNSVSADFETDALTVGSSFLFDSTSGDLKTGRITADGADAELNTVSGEIQLDGSFRQVTGGSTSGEYELTLRRCPEKIDLSTVSGKVELELPRSAAFTLRYSTVSGELESDFTMKRDGKRYICGDGGGCEITVSTTSGDLKAEPID